MRTTIRFRNDDKVKAKVFILDNIENISQLCLSSNEEEYVRKTYGESNSDIITINRYTECISFSLTYKMRARAWRNVAREGTRYAGVLTRVESRRC